MKAIFLLVFIVVFFRSLFFLDSDFGWHLRTGQITLANGVPKTDPFTYSMPSFPYVDTSWLTDFFIAKTFPILGQVGLAVVVSTIILITILINGFSLPLLLLTTAAILPFVTIRPLVVTWFIFAIFLRIGETDSLWKKWRIFIPLLFLVGANLHGGFISYLALLVILLFCRLLRHKLQFLDILILFFSLAITFINPYGPVLWREVLVTVTSTALKNNIVEWQTGLQWFNPAIAMLSATVFIFILRNRTRLNLFHVLSFLFYLASSFLALRNIPLLALTAAPLFLTGSDLLLRESPNKKRFFTAAKGYLFIAGIVFIIQTAFVAKVVPYYQEDGFYPKSAIEFLKVNPYVTPGQIFSYYSWGGYLIWKMPAKKVFIDGRMPVWIWNGPPNESSNAFGEYLDIIQNKKDFSQTVNKFKITTVLWPKFEKQWLNDPSWPKVYEDQTAVVYMLK